MITLTDDTFDDFLTEAEGRLVLVDFYADWCRPCRLLAPVLEELEREHPVLVVAKVDGEANPKLMAGFEVMSFPTLVLFDQGVVTRQIVGARPKARLVRELGISA